jgi:deazaflavin-dependent oxidoreductase (nitroreductase family)
VGQDQGEGVTDKAMKLPPKWIMKAISRTNVFVYRLTGGRVMGTLKGSPICLVTMIGRKSGREISMPLMYTPHGENVLIVASLGGAPQHPVWYHNLVANPDIMIQDGSRVRKMRARQASPEEKDALWPVCVASYSEFADYQARTDRDIPVMICEPR